LQRMQRQVAGFAQQFPQHVLNEREGQEAPGKDGIILTETACTR